MAIYASGRKALTYFTLPGPPGGRVLGRPLGPADLRCGPRDRRHPGPASSSPRTPALDDVYLVYTRFHSMLDQELIAVRMLPTEVVEGVRVPEPGELLPLYDFEPGPEAVLDALLPAYMYHRIYAVLLQAAACEIASRQRAMKAATDNADELIRTYTLRMNQLRQAGITQEISEIVGGANALAESADRD